MVAVVVGLGVVVLVVVVVVVAVVVAVVDVHQVVREDDVAEVNGELFAPGTDILIF
jgi:hypothetical protein